MNNYIFIQIYLNYKWGLGIGDWGLGIGPNPQSPIPNPQSLLNICWVYIIPYKIFILTIIK